MSFMNKLTTTLLVDDDETTNFVNQMLLEDMGVTEDVLVANNGQEALELVRQRCQEGLCPELILLDINMPVMNGFEFLEEYEQLSFPNKQSVVVVMLTTSLNPQDMDRLRDLPNEGFLNKPLNEKVLKELLRKHFDKDLLG